MRIYKYLHSCILLEKEGKRLLIDPGIFSFIEGNINPDIFTGVIGILITHEHTDHIDVSALKTILGNNHVVVMGNSSVQSALGKIAIPVKLFSEGEQTVGPFHLRAFPAPHGPILSPLPENTAYVVDDIVLHPGDSLDSQLAGIDNIKALALPVIAPWSFRVESIKFAASLHPEIIIPIHDGFIKDFFEASQNKIYGEYFSGIGIQYRPLGIGESIEI